MVFVSKGCTTNLLKGCVDIGHVDADFPELAKGGDVSVGVVSFGVGGKNLTYVTVIHTNAVFAVRSSDGSSVDLAYVISFGCCCVVAIGNV